MWATEIYKIEHFIKSKEKGWLLFLNPRLDKIFDKDCFLNFNFFVDTKSFINIGFEWYYYKGFLDLQIFYKDKKIVDSTINILSNTELSNSLTWNMLYHISSVIDNIVVVYQDFWVIILPKKISFVLDDKWGDLVKLTNIENIDVYSFKWEFLYSVDKKLDKDLKFTVKEDFLEYWEDERDKVCLLLKDKIIDNIDTEKFYKDRILILHYNDISNSTKDDKIVYAKNEIQELSFPIISNFQRTYKVLKEYNINEYKKIDLLYTKTLDYQYFELVLRNQFLSFDNSEEAKIKCKQLEENLNILGWEVEALYSSWEKTLAIGYIPELTLFISWNTLKYLKNIHSTMYLDTREHKIINIEKSGEFKVLKENIDSIELTKITNKKDEFNGFLSISSEFNLTVYDKNVKETSRLDLKNVLWDIKEVKDIIISKTKFNKVFWSNILFVWKLWSDKWVFIDKEKLSIKVVNIWPILNFSTISEDRNLRNKLKEWNFNRLSKEENTLFNKIFSKRRLKTNYTEEIETGKYLLKNVDCLATFWIKWINSLYEFSNKKLPEDCDIRTSYMLNLLREQKNLFFSLCYEEKLTLESVSMSIEEVWQMTLQKWKSYYIVQDNWKINYFQ